MAHGGRRRGAGRPKTVKRGGAHRERPDLDDRYPVHVVLRTHCQCMRQNQFYEVLRAVLAHFRDRQRDDFRITHVSLQKNHVHMIVEASDRCALTKGMQSFAIRFAKAYRRRATAAMRRRSSSPR